MKNEFEYSLVVYLLLFFLCSCGPRVDLDFGQWGDKAYLTNVQIFTLKADEHELQEYYESGMLTPAIRRKIISSGNALIDNEKYTAIIFVPSDQNLMKSGLIFYHQAEKIVPLNNAPIAGIITSLMEEVDYHYKVISADGSENVWTVTIVLK